MLRIVFVLVAGCTGFVKGPSKERRGVELVDCTDSYAFPVIDTALWAAVTTATIYAANAGTFDDCEALGCLILPYGVTLAVAMPIIATHGFERVHACRETKARVAHWRVIEEDRNARARAREHAWILTKQAAIAARADNCEAVRIASAKVRAEDPDFHATVFVRDVAIARCL